MSYWLLSPPIVSHFKRNRNSIINPRATLSFSYMRPFCFLLAFKHFKCLNLSKCYPPFYLLSPHRFLVLYIHSLLEHLAPDTEGGFCVYYSVHVFPPPAGYSLSAITGPPQHSSQLTQAQLTLLYENIFLPSLSSWLLSSASFHVHLFPAPWDDSGMLGPCSLTLRNQSPTPVTCWFASLSQFSPHLCTGLTLSTLFDIFFRYQ